MVAVKAKWWFGPPFWYLSKPDVLAYWKARNFAVFEGRCLRVHIVYNRILMDLVALVDKTFRQEVMRYVSWETLYSSVAAWEARLSYWLGVWERPLQGQYKLNTDSFP